jgi:adenosine deaminase
LALPRIAEEFCQDEAAQGVRYAEVTFTAAAHGERLDDPQMPLEAVLDGLAAGAARYGIQTRVILDHSRRRSIDRLWRSLKLATRYPQVIVIGLAGDESYAAAPFAEVFSAARQAGLHLVHHAGETAGPASAPGKSSATATPNWRTWPVPRSRAASLLPR